MVAVPALVIADAVVQTQIDNDLNDARRGMNQLGPILLLRAELRGKDIASAKAEFQAARLQQVVQEVQTMTNHNFNFNVQGLQNQGLVAALHEIYTTTLCYQHVPVSVAGGLWSGITPAVRQRMILCCRWSAARIVSSSIAMHHIMVTRETVEMRNARDAAARAQIGQ